MCNFSTNTSCSSGNEILQRQQKDRKQSTKMRSNRYMRLHRTVTSSCKFRASVHFNSSSADHTLRVCCNPASSFILIFLTDSNSKGLHAVHPAPQFTQYFQWWQGRICVEQTNRVSQSEHSSPFPVSVSNGSFDIPVQNDGSAFKHINGCGNCEGRCCGLGMVLPTKPHSTHSPSPVFLSLSMLGHDGGENWRHKR